METDRTDEGGMNVVNGIISAIWTALSALAFGLQIVGALGVMAGGMLGVTALSERIMDLVDRS